MDKAAVKLVARRRFRAIQSCLTCHTAKRKCDRGRPCLRCSRLGISKLCIYEDDDPDIIEERMLNVANTLRHQVCELKQRSHKDASSYTKPETPEAIQIDTEMCSQNQGLSSPIFDYSTPPMIAADFDIGMMPELSIWPCMDSVLKSPSPEPKSVQESINDLQTQLWTTLKTLQGEPNFNEMSSQIESLLYFIESPTFDASFGFSDESSSSTSSPIMDKSSDSITDSFNFSSYPHLWPLSL